MDNNLNLPKVSIIMPAYNAENYIVESINSVLNQTFIQWELIIIDDGSVDKTAEICKNYTNLDNRIHYIHQNNSKQAKARNEGINAAKSDIIAFLDADDLWLPNKLEISFLHFDQNNYDLIFTDSYFGSDEEISISKKNLKRMNIVDSEYFGKEALRDFIEYNRIPILTVLAKKKIIENVGLFDENCVPAEDYNLWLKLLKDNNRFISINLPLSIYRVQKSSSTAFDRLAADAVIKSIMRSFSSVELKELNVQIYLIIWIKHWILIYLNNENIKKLERIVNHFNHQSITRRVLFWSYKIIGLKIFRKLFLKLM